MVSWDPEEVVLSTEKESNVKKLIPPIVLALMLTGCGLTQPTFLDIPPEQLDQIAARLGSNVETLYTGDREILKAEISQAIGLKVDALEIPSPEEIRVALDLPEGEPLTQEQIIAGIKESGLVAEIQPAAEAAAGAGLEEVAADPSKGGAAAGGLTALGILIAGGLGLRGRARRKKKANGKAPVAPKAVAS